MYYQAHGPFYISCDKLEDEEQVFSLSDLFTKQDLIVKSGHACGVDKPERDLNGIRVKYGESGDEIDIGNDQRCNIHDGGVSCILPL